MSDESKVDRPHMNDGDEVEAHAFGGTGGMDGTADDQMDAHDDGPEVEAHSFGGTGGMDDTMDDLMD